MNAEEPRTVQADNAGLFALGGTRTIIVGRRKVAVVDPGPDDGEHREALLGRLKEAEEGVILLTHRHPDHAAGAPALARATGFPVRGADPRGGVHPLAPGERIATDGGTLGVVPTPGHASDHLAFFLRPHRILLAGDMLLGQGSTTWVGEYAGCVADYLESLDRVEALEPRRIIPAHGPDLTDPTGAVRRFRDHRLDRIRQVREALDEGVGAPRPASDEGLEALVDRVYGPELPPALREGARWSVRAILEYLGAAPFPRAGAPTEGGEGLLAPGS